ncbi:MAG: hypothetical protein MJ114_00325 [Acetatifactor sp.]|nr:hypothetical protein [Acetatifactor sp.]
MNKNVQYTSARPLNNGRAPKPVKRPAAVVLDVLIVIVGIVMALSFLIMFMMFRDTKTLNYKSYSFQSAMTYGEYSRMTRMANTNRMTDSYVGQGEYEEYYAVADYYEAEFYCVVFEKAGDTQQAAAWAAKRDAAAKKAQFYDMELKKISKRLRGGE